MYNKLFTEEQAVEAVKNFLKEHPVLQLAIPNCCDRCGKYKDLKQYFFYDGRKYLYGIELCTGCVAELEAKG